MGGSGMLERILALDLATKTGWAIRDVSGRVDSGVIKFTQKPLDRDWETM